MIGWGYRVVEDEHGCAIRWVRYDDSGAITWWGDPMEPHGDDPNDLRADIVEMLAATGRPKLCVRAEKLIEVEA